MNGKSDEEQLAFAATKGWTILTHDVRHFRELHRRYMEKGLEHTGIIVSKRMETGFTLHCLLNLLNQVSAKEARNSLLFLQNFAPKGDTK
ncbi:MAG TPA: hypothetical protein EYP19_05245 [Desulfobacterales bacterium]|nr:hypothetical protein [Desulfobacterales bacterium]